jgi:arsenate reductase-like glutaredoxin family protein
VTCKNAQEFLESVGGSADEVADAKKVRMGPAEALALARRADRVVAARGKKVVEFDLKKDAPDDETLLAVLLGPTGNLRAPAALVGRTLVVGFNPDVYREVLKVTGDR